MDAGSGAGFPGIPVAVVRPECSVVLVELDIRKSVFLREASLDLANCRVVRARLSEVREECDWLVSRALHWRELRRYGGLRGVALLVSAQQDEEIRREWRGVAWGDYRELPWSGQGGIVLGMQRTGA
jgi:hypothetical protein